MTPITKNGSELIRVFDVHGNELEATYPKRAKGLVRKGRAQWLGSVNHDDPDFVPDSILLYDNADWNSSPAEPADHVPRTADTQHTEVQSMFNNEITNNEYIPEINNTTEIPENAEEIDPAVQKMLENLSAHMTKTRAETAKLQEEANIAVTKARMEMEKQRVETEKRRREADEYAGISFPDFGEIPEIPAESVDYQSLLEGILACLNDISLKKLSDDLDIAAIETGHLHDLSETLHDIYHKTLNVRKEDAQLAVYSQKQKLLAERAAKLEEAEANQLQVLGKLFEDGLIQADQLLGQMVCTTMFYNEEIKKLIDMMN